MVGACIVDHQREAGALRCPEGGTTQGHRDNEQRSRRSGGEERETHGSAQQSEPQPAAVSMAIAPAAGQKPGQCGGQGVKEQCQARQPGG
jgi:hypothetical protein